MNMRNICPITEPWLHRSQAHRETRQYHLGGFTPSGRVAVLANALQVVGSTILEAEKELVQQNPSSWSVNGFLLTIIPCLQNLLDNIARACQEFAPIEEFAARDLYFHEFRFSSSGVVQLHPLQQKVLSLRFHGKSWYQFANSFKHEAPWVGQCSKNTQGVVDVYDADDVGVVYDVVVPVYKHTCAMLHLLGNLCDPKLRPSFPVV